MNYKKVFLIGMMYSGKTTIGQILASQIKFSFLDIDYEIQNILDMSINDIFKIHGEKKFRTLESVFFKECSNLNKHIFSTGGGLILNQDSYQILKNNKAVFFLDSSPEIIYKRFQKDSNKHHRPLLKNASLSLIDTIYKKRYDLYKSCSEFVINTDHCTPTEVANKIEMYLNA
tara:strand:- start:1303 stop:1821 length:519 start_codon:yes stop_codon:yes gene_type:complete